MKALIKKHPLAAYLLLTFGFSWGIFIPFLAISGSAITVQSPSTVIISLIIGLAPSLSALVITAIAEGSLKASSLAAHFRLKNSRRAYGAVLLIMPTYAVLNVLFSHLFVTPYKTEVVSFLIVLSLFWGLFSSFGEEFGWRGFMFPHMLQKRGWFQSTLIIGAVWALWHIPMNYLGARDFGNYMLSSVLLSGVQLVLDAFIISELFIINKGSVKITLLYHYTLTAMTIMPNAFFQPAEFSSGADLRTNLIGFAIKIAIAAVIYVTCKKKLAAGLVAKSTTTAL